MNKYYLDWHSIYNDCSFSFFPKSESFRKEPLAKQTDTRHIVICKQNYLSESSLIFLYLFAIKKLPWNPSYLRNVGWMWKNFDDHLSFSFPYSICRSPSNYGLKKLPKNSRKSFYLISIKKHIFRGNF